MKLYREGRGWVEVDVKPWGYGPHSDLPWTYEEAMHLTMGFMPPCPCADFGDGFDCDYCNDAFRRIDLTVLPGSDA